MPPPSLPPLPLLRHRSSHPKAISLFNCSHISSSLPPPLLSLPTLLPCSLAAAATQKVSTMLLEPSLVMHNSVDVAFDHHILLKGRHFCYLAYHSTLHSVTIAAAMPSSTVAVASVPLPSTSPSAFYCHLLRPLPPPLPFLHRHTFRASSSLTLAVVSVINVVASFAVAAAPISMLPLPVTIASVVPYANLLSSSLRQQTSFLTAT
ncbi:hypothetical protein B296_00019845 [Ensete ventricosum]|uniref:Uncharacterized protein n=1 Tax=Ensete ventricosum TaxID=4639 RepID=A0A426YP01_ENSVE|nr:hypothetical protein B296_00019845 [Ensete ventricosum]